MSWAGGRIIPALSNSVSINISCKDLVKATVYAVAVIQFASFVPLAQEEFTQLSVGPLIRVGVEPVGVNVKTSLAERLL